MDLLPLPFQTKETKTFTEMFKALERVGYRKGLTYQTLPYNYSLSYRRNELAGVFSQNIERVSKLTGKKVIVFGHSLGNLNTLFQFSQMQQEFKDKYIKAWIAATPPFLGAMQATKSILGGDDEYFFLKFIGFHFEASALSLGTFPVMYELMQKNMYTIYQNEPWFEWIQKRLDYEIGRRPFEDSGMSFWPGIDENCTPSSFTDIDTACYSGLDDLRKRPSVVVEDGNLQYFLNNNLKLVEDWPLLENTVEYFKMYEDPKYLELKNPGVPVLLVFSKSSDTIAQIHYKGKISDYTDKNEFPKANDSMGYGDGTVGTSSSLFPAIKWAYEFTHKDTLGPDAKSFKVIGGSE